MNRVRSAASRLWARYFRVVALGTALAGFGPMAIVFAQIPPPPPPLPSQPPLATSRLEPEADALAKFQNAAKAAVAKSAGAKFQIFILLPLSTNVDTNVENQTEAKETGDDVTAALVKAGIAADHIMVATLPGQDVPAPQVRLFAN